MVTLLFGTELLGKMLETLKDQQVHKDYKVLQVQQVQQVP
jgi:hypothetical protein